MVAKKKNSIMEFINSIPGKILCIVLGLYVVTSIVPALLNARNDFAVMMGMTLIIVLIVVCIRYGDKIIRWLNN